MRKSRWTTRLLSAALCVSIAIAGAEAGEQAAGRPPVDTWRAWQEAHPLPRPQDDKAEEAIVGELCSGRPLAEVRDALVEREVRREYLRLVALVGNRDHWNRVRPTTFRREAVVSEGDRDPADFVLRTARALLTDLADGDAAGRWAAMERELAALEARGVSLDVAREEERFALHRQVCALRRRIALANPLLDFGRPGLTTNQTGRETRPTRGRIVFVKRRLAVANHMCDQYYGNFARSGGGLFVLEDPFGDSPVVRNLLENATVQNDRLRGKRLEGGSFLPPALSYDGKTVLFAYTECGLSAREEKGTGPICRNGPRPTFGRCPASHKFPLSLFPAPDPAWGVEMTERPPWTPETSYHVFCVRADGTELTQLTDGPWNDLHPNWLPDGRIVFVSERRGGFGRCHGRPVPLFTLHAMDADGRNMVRLSDHEGNEWHPSVANDGKILYTRWDYVDRGHNQAHHPWITSPDGRDPRAIHGNFKPSHDLNPDMELNVAAIPGSHRFVATASAHHWQAYGSLIVIDPRVRDDDALAPVRRLTPDVGFPETAERGTFAYATAWPLSEDYYLCAYSPHDDGHGIVLLDAFGNRELLYRDPAIGCLGPAPVRPRPAPPIIPAVATPSRLAGNPTFHAVGDGHALEPMRPGTTEKAVVNLVNVYDSLYPFPEGVKIAAIRIVQLLPKSTPLHHQPQIGYGSETNGRAILGTVPVEEDGSACFQLPPDTSVYFQALDEDGCAVQSMRSATYVRPGEKLTCIGCHEPKGRSPAQSPAGPPRAFRRDPSEIRPESPGSNPVSFPLLVQPVLEKHCVRCHGQSANEPPDLRRGDWQQDVFHWYRSYRNLRPYAFHYGAPRDETKKNQYDRWQPARTVPGKFGARASRLLPLVDKGHYDVKLSPEERRRIILWLDANSDFFGAYEDEEAQARGEAVRPKLR
jgi:hypothetical protein